MRAFALERYALAFLALALIAGLGYAQPPDTLWTRVYGGLNWDSGLDGVQTDDGGFVMVGRTDSYGTGGARVWLIKTEANGDTAWTRNYGGAGNQVGYSVQQTNDGGYIMTGYTSLEGNNVLLIKTNANGDTVWTRTYGMAPGDEMGFCVQQTADGDYIVAGHTSASGAGGYDVWLLKIYANGDLTWSRTFGGTGLDFGRFVRETDDGGYVIAGYTTSYGAGGMDVWLIKANLGGIAEWDTTFGGTAWDQGYSVQQTEDGGYVIVGETSSYGSGGKDAWLIKTDAAGTLEWNATFGARADDMGNSVQQTYDGGYILTGSTTTTANGIDLWLIKTDAGGDTLWTAAYGGTGNDNGSSVQQTDDDGYFIVGNTQSFGAGSYDAWLIRIVGLPQPQILVSPGALDFDSVLVENSAELPMTIYNVGDTTLVLYSMTTTDPAFTTSFDPADSLLDPGDSLVVTVTFTPADTMIYEDTLLIEDNDEPVWVLISGVGKAPDWVGDENAAGVPTAYSLSAPCPNPFNPSTALSFKLQAASYTSLKVFDTAGRLVETLVDAWREAGEHEVAFDGSGLASGIYLARLEAGYFQAARKLVLMK